MGPPNGDVEKTHYNRYLPARSCVRVHLRVHLFNVTMLTNRSSLAAAIVRLLVQLQISNGGYAAHTDVNRTILRLPLLLLLTRYCSHSYQSFILEHD